MKPSIYRESQAIINLEAIRNNVRNECARLTSEQELFAVVKANGYGHGAVKVAQAAKEAGATGFCVSDLSEAIELREANLSDEPILVLSYVNPKYAKIALDQNISLTATSLQWLTETEQELGKTGSTDKLKVHLKIDTGMGRVGLRDESEFEQASDLFKTSSTLEMEGLFTHFATADSAAVDYFEHQQAKFLNAKSYFNQKIRYIHTSNSATALWHQGWESNVIRFGDAMYGMNPSGVELEEPFKLMPALSLETVITHIKELPPHEKIGYGITYETTDNEWIGTLPIGYADGLRRKYQGFRVIVDGEYAPIVGRICMDQCMIRLKQAYPIGTKVTIIGDNGDRNNSAQDAAEYIETINYEVTCALSDRLPRIYLNE